MNKARITLTIIMLSALLGGAFAFNSMRTLVRAYTYTGGITWISTTVGTKVYSTTVPICVGLSLGPSTLYVGQLGIPATNVYTARTTNTVFTTTISPGVIVSTTLPAVICNTINVLANTNITTVQ